VKASVIESLGAHCGQAAEIARHFLNAGLHQSVDRNALKHLGVGAADYVLADFERRKWIQVDSDSEMSMLAGMPTSLADFLDGASAMQKKADHDLQTSAVVTMPSAPSEIARILPTMGVKYAALEGTDDALMRIASNAVSRLTIITPFLNREGLSFALRIFGASNCNSKTLITRRSRAARQAVSIESANLIAAKIRVLNYFLLNGDGYETFHAKVVLSDDDLAYVGSANMTFYQRNSMELGVVVDGRAAATIATVVRGIEAIATPFGHL